MILLLTKSQVTVLSGCSSDLPSTKWEDGNGENFNLLQQKYLPSCANLQYEKVYSTADQLTTSLSILTLYNSFSLLFLILRYQLHAK